MLLFVLLLLQEPPTLDALLKELRSGNLDQQDAATEKLLERCKDWSDADLATLKEAQKDADSAFAERAKSALASIVVRRRLGDRLLKKVKKIDEVVLGEISGRGRVILSTTSLVRGGDLASEDLQLVVAIAVEQKWELPSDLLLPMADQPELRPLLVLLLASAKPATRASAVQAFGRIGALPLADAIASLAKDPDEDVRSTVARALSLLDAREQSGAITTLLKDPNAHVRQAAASAAGSLRIAKDELMALEKDDAWKVRLSALEALGRLGVDLAGRHEALLKDKNPLARQSAARSIGTLRIPKDAVLLVPLLKDDAPDVRTAAASAMGRLAASDKETLSALAAMAESRDAEFDERAAAKAAVLRLTSKKGPEWSGLLRRDWHMLRPETRCDLLDALAATYAPKTWAKLDEPFNLLRDVNDRQAAVLSLQELGIDARFTVMSLFAGRFSKGRSITPREIIDRVMQSHYALVADGPRLIVCHDDQDARSLWLGLIEKK